MAKIFVASFRQCLKNSDQPEKIRVSTFSAGARRLQIRVGAVQCRERLGGWLRYYHRQAA
jgi:hypothetical protein